MVICHVCKKEKKPYTVFLKNDVLSLITYMSAREKGEICQRCDQYYAMTGIFKDASEREFEVAKKACWFARMMQKWWEKDIPLGEENNLRSWAGTESIKDWCRELILKDEVKK